MKTRQFILPVTALSFMVSGNIQATNTPQTRPNIVLFMVDDMGWEDTSLSFWKERTKYNDMFETPNMERLAQRGMMFTQAYASSISSPSRCSLFTGSNAARHRVTNWTLEKGGSNDGKSDIIELPEWNVNGICQVSGIPFTYQATSLAQLLKDNGYHTIHCGKAHLGARNTPGLDSPGNRLPRGALGIEMTKILIRD